MAEQLWFSVLFALGMAGMWWLLGRGVEPPALDRGGVLFRYPRGVAYLGWAFLAFGAVFIGWMVTALAVETASDVAALTVLAAVFAVPGLWALAARRREWARLTADGIEIQGVLASEPARVRWAEVARVSFGRVSGAFVFRTTDGRTLRASGFFSGAGHLAEAVAVRLADRGGPEAAQALAAYRQQVGV